jgi:hypothetical protein
MQKPFSEVTAVLLAFQHLAHNGIIILINPYQYVISPLFPHPDGARPEHRISEIFPLNSAGDSPRAVWH